MKTIIFCFAGRRANIELQLPCIKRILAAHPDVEYDIWDCSLTDADHEFLQTISGDRINVVDDLYVSGCQFAGLQFNDIYRHYTDDYFRDYRFVKVDEDVVFLQDDRFGDFIDAIDAHPEAVITAQIINNGAGTRLVPTLFRKFEVGLSEVHRSVDYAKTCHQYMFEHWRELVSQPVELIPAQDWLSINLIGYTWEIGCEITRLVGQYPAPTAYDDVCNIPAEIFANGTMADGRACIVVGDEGVINLFPRLIMQGFVACHLYFGPQRNLMDDTDIADLQKRYAEVGRLYRET